MHPAIIYIRNANKEVLAEIKTKISFCPELTTTIFYNKMKASVTQVIIDINPAVPVIIIHSQIK